MSHEIISALEKKKKLAEIAIKLGMSKIESLAKELNQLHASVDDLKKFIEDINTTIKIIGGIDGSNGKRKK
jgi:FtsZ-binding cell division protein ZapB